MKKTRSARRKIIVLASTLLLASFVDPGGASGQCASFRRGDANTDGDLDITDGITILLFLFSGATQLSCHDAADTLDDGSLDITDAINLFQYLFAGGAPPLPPGPEECGQDDSGFDELTCEVYPPCAPQSSIADFSGFTIFHYEQRPGLGFCPEVDRLYDATLTQDEDGIVAQLSVLQLDDPKSPDFCEWSREHRMFGDVCVVPVPIGSRVLTPDEAEAVLFAFSGLEVLDGPDPICNCIVIDPCRIRTFDWDGDELSDFACGGRRVAEVDPLLELLESLK